jgi:hypothetical protein
MYIIGGVCGPVKAFSASDINDAGIRVFSRPGESAAAPAHSPQTGTGLPRKALSMMA